MAKYRRKNYLINKKVQIKYALLTILLLTSYSAILLAAIFAPYFMALYSDIPLQEQAAAADVILLLHGNLWVGIVAIIILCGIYTLFITHKIAGPTFLFTRLARDVRSGDFSRRIRLRKGDDFHDVADDFNSMVDAIEASLVNIDKDYKKLLSFASELETQLKSKDVSQQTLENLARDKGVDKENMMKFLDKYTFSKR
ncbi:MAG: methyl-accepting chemotaxis protein [Proteobacteria bacterium]|nr:methyl-accepting chemotaxis protein [Pseudomonadota bacterium]